MMTSVFRQGTIPYGGIVPFSQANSGFSR